MATPQQQLTSAYQKYLGRAPEAGQLDWRVGQAINNPIANQIKEIASSAEAQAYAKRTATAAPKAAPKPAAVNPNSVQGLTQQVAALDKSYQNPVDIYNKALTDMGVVDVRTNVTNLRKALSDNQALLDALPGNIQQRTSNSLVSEAQRQRLVASEAEPLQSAAGKIGANLATESANYQDLLAQAGTQAGYAIQGQQEQRQALIDRLQIAKDNAKTAEEKRQFDAQLKLEKAKFAETKRQFNVQQAAKSTGGGGGGGGGGGKTPAPKKISKGEAESVIRSALKPGKDGYISPSQWNSLLKDWNAEGLSTSEFVSAFKNYANPWHYQSKANSSKYGAYNGIAIKG